MPSFILNHIETRKMYKQTLQNDKQRLLKYGFAYNHSKDNLRAHLRMLIHFVEKGLTMPSVRPCFGISRLRQIANIVNQLGRDNAHLFEMQYVTRLMDEYLSYHNNRGIDLPEEHLVLIKTIQDIVGSQTALAPINQRHYNRSSFFSVSDGTFTNIAHSRHSVRNYISKPIDKSIFLQIADVANTAPSACNRQPCKMHVVANRQLIDKIFSLGVGCQGFGHLAPAVILVTSDLICRNDITERFQVGVDAGFFGMNLLYALHEKGIGACVLNWDNIKNRDEELRKLIPSINDSETILFLISCGYTTEEFDIPLGLKVQSQYFFHYID